MRSTWTDFGMCARGICATKNKSAPAAGAALPATRPPSASAAPAREGQWLRPYPSPPCGGSPPIPNTCAPLRGYLGGLPTAHCRARAGACAPHIGNLPGSREAAHSSPSDEAPASPVGRVPSAQVFDRAAAPRKAGAPECTWRRILSSPTTRRMFIEHLQQT